VVRLEEVDEPLALLESADEEDVEGPSRSSSNGSALAKRSRSTPFGMIRYSPGK
jgi:hypothetical protein